MTARVKICGITRAEDARAAARLGADYLGLIFFPPSPRRIDPRKLGWMSEVRDEFPDVEWVGVFVDPAPAEMTELCDRLELDLLQIHTSDPAQIACERPWIWATHAAAFSQSRDGYAASGAYGLLLDTPAPDLAGGTGRTFDWRSIEPLAPGTRLFLAGGLGPDNVREAITIVRPFAVDACSRLESEPGVKDHARLAAFFSAIARSEEAAG